MNTSLIKEALNSGSDFYLKIAAYTGVEIMMTYIYVFPAQLKIDIDNGRGHVFTFYFTTKNKLARYLKSISKNAFLSIGTITLERTEG